jgi:hypothetical protein
MGFDEHLAIGHDRCAAFFALAFAPFRFTGFQVHANRPAAIRPAVSVHAILIDNNTSAAVMHTFIFPEQLHFGWRQFIGAFEPSITTARSPRMDRVEVGVCTRRPSSMTIAPRARPAIATPVYEKVTR